VNGSCGPERDVPRTVRRGEWRVEVEARRWVSIDPVLRILDGSGKQLARSDDNPAQAWTPGWISPFRRKAISM
jgi:hypothetical protein